MKEVINYWIENQLQDYCDNECHINSLMCNASAKQEEKLITTHCENCVARLFVEKITK